MTTSHDHTNNQDFIQQLLAPERAQRVDIFAILTFSELSDRDTVADIGCGPGFFTIPLAKGLSNGKLYALDIDDAMLDACRQRVTEARLGNVEVLKCDEFDFPLEPGSLNGLFLAFVVHHSPDKPRFLQAVRELLRPRGWCTVLEWYRKETESGPPLELRVDPDELRQLATEAGFRYMTTRNLNSDQYMATLRKA
ncbi:MAG: class I SAM-dependent methyltransferase [Chloroflexi bacterium]|nr:class I SAM-dependent methyltransferase [Chloroflexota bacterium]MDA1218765.1 class I SAM-dependent methyltransferase [Chloroflexota bacterium]